MDNIKKIKRQKTCISENMTATKLRKNHEQENKVIIAETESIVEMYSEAIPTNL